MALKKTRKVKGRRPVSTMWKVSNPFGKPGPYIAGVHTGIDYAVPVGTEVHSPRYGKVITSAWDEKYYGNYIIIEWWRGGERYLLAHLSERKVREGQRVRRGQVVGLSGNTGNSTGPHLHAEQRHSPYGYRDFEKPSWA